MNGYHIAFARSAHRELQRLPAAIVQRIVEAIRLLADDPRPRGSRKLAGDEATYRIRVGTYRVVFEIDDAAREVVITRVRHRKDAYQ